MAETLFDDAAAQTHFPVVEDGGLARGDRSLFLVEDDPDGLVVDGLDQAGNILLAVAGLDGAATRLADRGAIHPVQLAGNQTIGVEAGMFALRHHQHVAFDLFVDHIPGLFGGIFAPADTEPLALAQGVIHQTLMLADHLAIHGLDFTGLGGQELGQEVLELALADKADTGGVFLLGGDEIQLLGDAAHLRLFQIANREQALTHLLFAQGIEEVALILVGIETAQQARAACAVVTAHIVAGGDVGGTQLFGGKFEERLELDLLVAQDIRVRRAASLVLFEEVLEHIVPVLGREVDGVEFHPQLVADGLGISQILGGRAVLVRVVFFPVLHEQAFDLIALLLEQVGRDGRIHAAGHADDHLDLAVVCH